VTGIGSKGGHEAVTEVTALFDGLLPPTVKYVQAAMPKIPLTPGFSDEFVKAAESTLYPEERAHVALAVARRRAEFAVVRGCAREALGLIGHPPTPILPGPNREPLWPEGVLGSMTHCDGYCAAAVAPADQVPVLGIDAEEHAPLPEGVLEVIVLETERARLEQLSASDPSVYWDRVLFSAKESVYKAWFPLMRSWLGFAEADIVLRPGGEFDVTLQLGPENSVHGPFAPTGFVGRWTVKAGLTATAITQVIR
jgi:4'-phosphopantetheinyl transferase EntD